MPQHGRSPARRIGPKLQRVAWVARAVTLATQGYSIRRIADAVGKSRSAVHQALHEELEERRAPDEQIEMARRLKSERLYRQLASWGGRSLNGDPHAGQLVVRFEALLASLEGTNAPERTELTGRDGAPIQVTETVIEASPADARRVMKELFPDVDPATPADEQGGGDVPSSREPEKGSSGV